LIAAARHVVAVIPLVVSKRLGHANASMTLEVYAHVDDCCHCTVAGNRLLADLVAGGVLSAFVQKQVSVAARCGSSAKRRRSISGARAS